MAVLPRAPTAPRAALALVLLLAQLLLLAALPAVHATVEFGYVHEPYDASLGPLGGTVVYLSRFYYAPASEGEGSITYELAGTGPETVSLLFFDDEANSWPSAYNLIRDMHVANCAQLFNLSFTSTKVLQVGAGQIVNGTIDVHGAQIPRYVIVVAAACNAGVDLDFYLEFLNPGGFLQAQFSYEDQGLVVLLATVLCFLAVLVAAAFILALRWRKRFGFPIAFRVACAPLGLLALQFLVLFLDQLVYGVDGVGLPIVIYFGQLAGLIATATMAAVLLVSVSGLTLELPRRKLVVLGVGLGCYALGSMILYLWSTFGSDPAIELYEFESLPNVLLLATRFVVWCWFLVQLRFTMRDNVFPAFRSHYVRLGIIGSVWFASTPVIVGMTALAPMWMRPRIALSFVYLIDLAFAALLFALLRPPFIERAAEAVAQFADERRALAAAPIAAASPATSSSGAAPPAAGEVAAAAASPAAPSASYGTVPAQPEPPVPRRVRRTHFADTSLPYEQL